MPVLNKIILYPIKSLAGISVTAWPLVKTGLQYDRCWMLVDSQGEFLSQRRLATMALIQTQIKDNQLWLSAQGHADISMPLTVANGELITVKVWEYTGQGQTVSNELDSWFTQVLNHPCRLVYHPDHQVRSVDPDYGLEQDQTAYSDGFPLLLTSEASLHNFNQRSGLAIDMRRFRSNLVVGDCAAYAEDLWRTIVINDIRFRLPKPCSRCAIPAINPNSALSEKAVLTALSKFRQRDNKVYFGQNLIHDATGILTVGADINILTLGEPQPLLLRENT